MQKHSYLRQILDNILSDSEKFNLSLGNSNDELSKLCKAFIIQFYKENPDYNDSCTILETKRKLAILLHS